ncbi:aspartic peptidase domain-containing protein [Boletus coccyginus]|nr:aspartic peptidase domain-containing protein [Boletus coccyginus]
MLSLLFLALLPLALAAPQPDAGPIHVPIVRRATPSVADLPRIMDAIRVKYGFTPKNQKRSTTTVPLTDEQNDSSYSATVSIGTPAQPFNLIIDTGSADLWVATTQCTTCSSDVPLFNPSESSSFKNGSSSVKISYGSGSVRGYVSQDTVNFAGFSIANQPLLSVSTVSSDMIDDGLSGIMGLGFETISAIKGTPFWQTLSNEGVLSFPCRYVDQDPLDTAPGGTLTLGGTNTSLYSGDIEFIDMPNGTTPSYWLQQLQSLTVQGKSIAISSSEGLAAIDTGTTLIAAPSDITKQIWSHVPGSVALTGTYDGMYGFPCSTSISITLSFGGTIWPISSTDMNLGLYSGTGKNQMCVGGIFDIGSTDGGGEGLPAWIIGDVFLKNVYTVFQANPPAVGFAQLASGLG